MTGDGSGAPQRLDLALVERGLARSRSHAASLVKDGRVAVDGRPVVKPSALVDRGADLTTDVVDEWVSRGALKLLAALDRFGIDPSGLVALDAGASTGGFSQVLLERGAAKIVAIDVGHGQLSSALRPYLVEGRLVSLEGVNVRELVPAALEAALGGMSIGLVVADLSFISLRLALPALRATAPEAELVVLIKPQFEVGRTGVREGIVRDAGLRADAISGVLWAAHDLGLRVAGIDSSPIIGSHGNSEYLAHLSPRVGGDPSEWTDRIYELAGA